MIFPILNILVLCLFQLGFSCNKYSILDLIKSDVLAKGTVVSSSGRILKFKVSKFIWGDSIPLVKNIVFFPSGIQEYDVDFEFIMEKDSLTSGVSDLGIDDSNFVDKTFYAFFAKSNSDTVLVRECQQSGLINSIGEVVPILWTKIGGFDVNKSGHGVSNRTPFSVLPSKDLWF